MNNKLKDVLDTLKFGSSISNTVSTRYSSQQNSEHLQYTYPCRRDGLKSRWAHAREGSTPSLPTLDRVHVCGHARTGYL